MERKVGEIFEYNGEWYQCVEGIGCYRCAFYDKNICIADNPHCTCRSDKKNVIFKKLEKVGEPYVYDGRIMQKYKDVYSPTIFTYKSLYCYNGLDGIICIEIPKNKENMEEKKLNYEELEHYYDSTCGLWAIDRNPKEVTLEWIVENAFQLGDATHEKACVSNLKPFDLEAAKHGKPVCIRDGRKVRIICFDAKCDKPIIALMYDCNEEFILKFLENGRAFADKIDKYDLMMLPEKKEGWVNIYKDFEDRICCIYKTKEEALEKKETEDDYITTVKIEWEE